MLASIKDSFKGFGTDSNLTRTNKVEHAWKDSKTTKTLPVAVIHLVFELFSSKLTEVLFLGPTLKHRVTRLSRTP
jgi:hypothetical protein